MRGCAAICSPRASTPAHKLRAGADAALSNRVGAGHAGLTIGRERKGMTNPDAGTELSMMATVNGVIDKLHSSLGLTDSDFFCECGHVGCRERIKLTRNEYSHLRDDERPVLATDHEHRHPGVHARPRARRAAPQEPFLSGEPSGR